MLCEKCGVKDATIHMVQVINGNKTQQHLCSDCANIQEQSWFDTGINVNKMFSGFFEPTYNHPIVKCDSCGVTFDEFLKTGLLGCSQCYSAFEQMLTQPLKRLQGGAISHRGKKLVSTQPKEEKTQEPSRKEQLKLAIETEDYELAAELRDRIREQEAE